MYITSALFGLLAPALSALASPTSSLTIPVNPNQVVPSNNPAYTQPPGADALIAWTQAAIVSFFPNHTSWASGFDASMSPQLSATFGLPGAAASYAQTYNFAGFRNLYSGLYTLLSGKLSSHVLEFADAVAYPFPNDPVGGLVYSTTIEYGTFLNGTRARPAREAAFAVVQNIGRSQRRIVEIRKMSNFVIS